MSCLLIVELWAESSDLFLVQGPKKNRICRKFDVLSEEHYLFSISQDASLVESLNIFV